MMLIQTIFAFLVVLAVLIVVHELGHYWAARWCGVKVLRFSVGMGKVIWSRRIGPDQTEWAVSLLPLGGYVKMLDAREKDIGPIANAEIKREFTSQSVWRRIVIVAAGPLANFLLAIAIFTGLYIHGVPEPLPKLRAVVEQSAAYRAGLRGGELIKAVNGELVQVWSELRWSLLQSAVKKIPAQIEIERRDAANPERVSQDKVTLDLDSLSLKDLEGDFLLALGLDLARPPALIGKVNPDGPAARAGLREGDLIRAVDDVPIADGLALIDVVRAAPDKVLRLQTERGHQTFEVAVTPQSLQQDGKKIGRIQVELKLAPEMITASAAPWPAFSKSVARTWDTSVLTLRLLGKMLIGEVSLKNLTGPITIADYAGQTARIGAISFLSFIAFVSISLGVMNLLPIPVLDGGLLLYYAFEVLTGRTVSERFGALAQRAGVGVLMTLMLVAMFNDIVRLIS